MADKGKPIPPGVAGITMQSAQAQPPGGAQTPLDPNEMWQNVVQPKRGFESRPFNADDRYRGIPSAPIGDRLDPNVRGAPVGFGVDTVGSVQLIDPKGEKSWIGVGHFTTGGPEEHAEAVAIRGLRANGPKSLQGSKIMVVVDQIVCDECRKKLNAYAKEVGAEVIEIYHPRAENARMPLGSGVMNSPKTSSRGSFRGPKDAETPLRPTIVSLEEKIELPKPPGGGAVGGGSAGRTKYRETLEPPGYHDTQMRTAIKGACLNLAAGVALGIFQEKFKGYMLDELARMPKPAIDRSTAKDFYTNPHSGKAVEIINVLTTNTGPFAGELAEHHMTVIGTGVLELSVLRIAKVTDQERLDFLTGIQDELDAYDDNLRTIQENLEAARQLGPRALDTAQGAEDLSKMIDRAIVLDWMLKQGFSLEEAIDIYTNLRNYAARVRGAFQGLDTLYEQVLRQRDQLATLRSDANKFYWLTILSIAAQKQKMTEQVLPASPDSLRDTSTAGAVGKPAAQTKPAAPLKPKTIPAPPLR